MSQNMEVTIELPDDADSIGQIIWKGILGLFRGGRDNRRAGLVPFHQVTVEPPRNTGNRNITVTIPRGAEVIAVKRDIQQHENIPVMRQRLLKDGVELSDDHILEYDPERDIVLTLELVQAGQ